MSIYPVTIVSDRYGGTYSGGKFLAFNNYVTNIPWEIFADDTECAQFWDYTKMTIGKGNTPDEALVDLINKKEAAHES